MINLVFNGFAYAFRYGFRRCEKMRLINFCLFYVPLRVLNHVWYHNAGVQVLEDKDEMSSELKRHLSVEKDGILKNLSVFPVDVIKNVVC